MSNAIDDFLEALGDQPIPCWHLMSECNHEFDDCGHCAFIVLDSIDYPCSKCFQNNEELDRCYFERRATK
jgi:hypothetical protein